MKDRRCFECGGPHLARDCPSKGSKGAVKSIEEALQPALQHFLCVSHPESTPRRPRPRIITMADFPPKFVTKVKNRFEIFTVDEAIQENAVNKPEVTTVHDYGHGHTTAAAVQEVLMDVRPCWGKMCPAK